MVAHSRWYFGRPLLSYMLAFTSSSSSSRNAGVLHFLDGRGGARTHFWRETPGDVNLIVERCPPLGVWDRGSYTLCKVAIAGQRERCCFLSTFVLSSSYSHRQ